MKLYATVTSERASKGQGGNKYLDVDVMGGDKNNPTPLAHIHAVIITREDGVGYIKVCFYSETEDTLNPLHRVDIPLPIERKKGKRQKGEGERCYKCERGAKYATHTDKEGKVLPHARFTCEEHHYSD